MINMIMIFFFYIAFNYITFVFNKEKFNNILISFTLKIKKLNYLKRESILNSLKSINQK